MKNKYYKKFMHDCNWIEEYYENLVTLTKNHNYVGSTNEWIIDNFYLVVENRNNIKKAFKDRKDLKQILDENIDIYKILSGIFNKYHFNMSESSLIKELKEYQIKNSCFFTYRTISAIPTIISMIIIEELSYLCERKMVKQEDILNVQELMKKIDAKRIKNENINLKDFITIDDAIINHPVYLYHLNANLKELGSISNDIFAELNEVLNNYDIDLKKIIKDEHLEGAADSLLVANIFNNLKILSKLEVSTLNERISRTETLLKSDTIYKNMTHETKELYRRQIIKNTQRKDEYKYVEALMEKSVNEEKHIGFYLFKKEKLKLRGIAYISFVATLSLLISWFLSPHLLNIRWLSFLLILVPVSEVVIQMTNKIISRFLPVLPLPKMDFSKGIPKEQATMVVIPTLVKDVKKANLMFEYLEKYYLANKTSNLYFTLLADCAASDTADFDNDESIANFGILKSEELNNRYNGKIFSFIYRRRQYSKGENCYLGHERKRGALIHFNKLLLGLLSKEDKEKYIYVENLSEIKDKIKYAITIDVDTELVLNTAQKLVGVMAHPLNQPVLNKSKTKVIRGYGLVQPRVSVDIEATNASPYSQLIAGIGGFDVYSNIVPNFYQDLFKEGSFVGKGIYDVEIFEGVLGNALPENKILSHDLLEGCYMRCGYASDIELIDGFPAEFLADASRQHRWARGDVQIAGWLKSKVYNTKGKKVKNPINLIGKFKIFDNLRRIFINPFLLLLLGLSFFISKYNPALTITFVVSVISLPIIFYIKELLIIQKSKLITYRHYDNLIFGSAALVSRVFINFITIPYYSYMYLNAFGKATYRMLISHKNLLNWVTAEDAAKTLKNNKRTYIKAFKANYFAAFVIVVSAFAFEKTMILPALMIGVSFAIAPLILWLVSQSNKKIVTELNNEEKEEIKEIAFRTWLYFDTLLTDENNYLIPDNYQVNREIREDNKTSPTDIGMSLLSIISAHELGFIVKEKTLKLLSKVITSIEKLEKWNGHLYNWYHVGTMDKLYPHVVSSVDSANLAASLIVVKEFADKIGDNILCERASSLYNDMKFNELYTSDKDVFSVVYDTAEDKLSIYNYNKFASESRILSYIAIAKGDVPSKHWLCLDKSLIKYKGYKGLASWSGTSFEYFMPTIFMKSYPNTLLDESYFFAEYCQKSYMEEVNKQLPWGISESAYDELDDGQNYKYKAFSTPYLKIQEDKNPRIVLSPYSSAMAIIYSPKEVYNNLKKFKKLGMYSDFGFFESYDYEHEEKVFAYFAHHQGMILSAMTNYLKDNVIQKYFHSDVRNQAFEILLKEKVQINPTIDLKIFSYKKYNYEKEKVQNDIRDLKHISDIPEVSVLSNSHYMTLLNDRGCGFSRYGTTQLNRYRKITEQDYGIFVYVKDLADNKVWSNTYAPMNTVPDKYNVVFASDRIKYMRLDNEITTKTEIIVTKEESAEIRKITFNNHSNKAKKLELTTYTEPIIVNNIEDITHRTFKNLFESSEFDSETGSLIMSRKNSSKKSSSYFFNRLVVADEEIEVSYETERARFIGRNRNTNNPIALTQKNLSSSHGTNIDPIMSLRSNIEILPGKKKEVYFIAGFGKSKDQINKIMATYNNNIAFEEAFDYATAANNINTKLLGVSGSHMRLYNIMLNYLYQTSKHCMSPERKDILTKNALNQTNLWKFGISGDYPLILIEIYESESLNLVKEIIKAYEYYKSKAVFVDIVVVNHEKETYKPIINREIEKEKYRMNTLYDFMNTPGRIYVVDSEDITNEEAILLRMAARLSFNTRKSSSLEESIETLQKENKMIGYDEILTENKLEYSVDTKELKFYNEFGGFVNNGKEYLITNPDTPTPWSNVLVGTDFGSIVTNNNCGFTYALNSGMFKITSWTNDIVLNDKSEGIKVDDKVVDASACKHGFGYSTYYNITKDYDLHTTQFVSRDDHIKFYLSKIINKTKEARKYKITYWINPSFGPNEEKSSRYILTDYFEKLNAILLRNVYNSDFSHITAFLTSTEKITSYEIDKVIFRSIDIEVNVGPGEEKTFAFMLGSAVGDDAISELAQKYDTTGKIEKELEEVKGYWEGTLNTIQIKTPDESFNYMQNGWLLYQAIASRIKAKAGFYQVGGAFGYRDQLQDTTNICLVDPSFTRSQIINNAKHQFKEGDVLHWWHELTMFGLRSRYKDDLLWLIHAVSEYIKITDDDSILSEKVPFATGPLLGEKEEERGMNYGYTEETATIYEHCMLAIDRSIGDTGKNGLPLMGGGDWNDGMNKIGIEGEGTSVWLGFFQHMQVEKFIELTKKYDKKRDITKYANHLNKLKNSLNTVGWDKEYYLRAFFDNGAKVGSSTNNECKIDLISQSFSILSDVIEKDRIPSVIKSVETNLVDKDLKIIKLLTPPFKESRNNPGYIMDYPEGIRENGGQYTHATAWYIQALIKLGYVERAFKYYQMINPINRTTTKNDVLTYHTEPYVIAADIYSNKNNPARGGWSWYTGSAGWYYNVAITNIIGFDKTGNTLKISPNVPQEWDSYEIEYRYMATLYKIKVNLKQKNNNITIDGEKVSKEFITLKNDKRTHAVIVNVKEREIKDEI